jgi:predicted transcriptional regulator
MSTITLEIPDALFEKMTEAATKFDKSVSELLEIAQEKYLDLTYEQAMQRSLARMERGYNLGVQKVSREELHER